MEAAGAQMTAQFVVVLTDEDSSDRGEIKVLDSADEVARFIEVLLEGGFGRERIRVFQGGEIALKVSYRPVVSLSAAKAALTADDGEAGSAGRDGRDEALPGGEEASEAQGIRDGVRFSELFRPS